MIKIESLRLHKISMAARLKKEDSQGKFKSLTAGDEIQDSSQFQQLSATSALMPLQELLDLQAIEVANPPKIRTKEVGENILKELDKLHLSLLQGDLLEQDLHHLASIVDQKFISDQDPQLDVIVQEIEQRLAIEIAKLEML